MLLPDGLYGGLSIDAIDGTLLIAMTATLAAGVLRGFSGFGAALMQAPIFALLYPPGEAVAMIACLGALASLVMLPSTVKDTRWSVVALMTVAALASVPLGTWLLLSLDPGWMRRGISAVVLALALVLASGWRWHGKRGAVGYMTAGALSGIINGAASTGGPPVILYLLSGPDSAAVNRANLTSYYAFLNIGTVLALVLAGVVTPLVLWRVAFLMPVFGLGLWGGTHLFRRSGEAAYRRLALVLLVAVALTGLLYPG